MLIYGHKLIKTPKFYWVKNDEIKPNAINCFVYDEKLIEKAKNTGAEFAILAQNADEILLANALSAKFILIDSENLLKNKAKNTQKTSANSAKKTNENLNANLVAKASTNLNVNSAKADANLNANLTKKVGAKLTKKASKMAEFYLFDSKILLITNSLDKLKKAYKFGVDGVIVKECIK